MSALERLAQLIPLRRRATAQVAPVITPGYLQGQPTWQDWSVKAAVREGYRAHIAVYRCVHELAGCVSSVPWVVKRMRPDGTEAEAPPGHPAWRLVRKANPQKSWSQYQEELAVCVLLAGNHYTYTARVGDALELWRLRPDRVQVIPGRSSPAGYLYRVDSHEVTYPVEEVVHHRFFDPGDDWYGLSPLRAAARVVDTDNATVDWNKYSMDNRARPDGVVSVNGQLSKKQHEALLEQIREQRSGASNARRVIVVSGGEVSWHPMNLTPVEVDFAASHQMYSRDVCMAFGVHPEALGLTEATYENKKWAIRAMWDGPVFRLLTLLRDGLNSHLEGLWGEGVFLDFDLSETPAVVEARREKVQEGRLYWQMGVPFNVVNDELGLDFDPVPGGDTGYLPATLMPTGADRGAQRAEKSPSARRATLGTEEQRAAYWRAIDGTKQAWERRVADVVRTRFRAEAQAVSDVVAAGVRDTDTAIDSQAEAWHADLKAVWQAVFEHFSEDVFADVARTTGPGSTRQDLWTPEVAEWVAHHTAENVVAVQGTTKRWIRAEVAAGMEANEGTDLIAARIRNKYATWTGDDPAVPFDRSRSYVIARTEVHSAGSYGIHKAAEDSGAFSQKRWLTARDGRERESHGLMDGEPAAMGEPYSNGLMFPGDPDGEAGEVVNCRCVETYEP